MSSKSEPVRHFITGGAGFIGSHLVARLVVQGDKVTVYDNLSSGHKDWIQHHIDKDGVRFIEADMLDMDSLTQAMAGHDLVWHLGANTDIPAGRLDVGLDINNCTLATHNVLKAIRAHGIKRLIFSSTSALYGDPPVLPASETAGPLRPISLYGAAKLACEALISAYCHLFGIQAWMFRFANVVGPRMGHGILRDFVAQLRRDPAELGELGDGNQEKTYCVVEDCVEGVLPAVRHAHSKPCDVFNLGCASTI